MTNEEKEILKNELIELKELPETKNYGLFRIFENRIEYFWPCGTNRMHWNGEWKELEDLDWDVLQSKYNEYLGDDKND